MDPTKKPEEPRPSQPQAPPPQTPPNEAPETPNTEYEREVPHTGSQPIARTADGGEGSYEGTRQYDEGLEQFTQEHSPDESLREASEIDPDDPELVRALEEGKRPRPSKPQIEPDAGRRSAPSAP